MRRKAAGYLLILGVLAGVVAAQQAKPPEAPAFVISASLPGAGVDEVVNSVASPLEKELAAIDGVKLVESETLDGSTDIAIRFSSGKDIDASAREVLAAVLKAKLPAQVHESVRLRRRDAAEFPVAYFAAWSPSMPLSAVSDFVRERIAKRLATVTHVGEVEVYGDEKPAVRIQPDLAVLESRGVTLADIEKAVADAARGVGPGLDELKTLVVAYGAGQQVPLGEVAKVIEGASEPRSAAWFNHRRAVIVAIRRSLGADASEVRDGIRQMLNSMRSGIPLSLEVDEIDAGPGKESGFVAGEIRVPAGASFATRVARTQPEAEMFADEPKVQSVVSVLPGTGDAQIWITLKPSKNPSAAAAEVAWTLRDYPALRGVEMLWQVPETGAAGAFTDGRPRYTLTSADQKTLDEWMPRVVAKLRAIADLAGVAADLRFEPRQSVTVDHEKARSLGVAPERAERIIAATRGGIRIATFRKPNSETQVILDVQLRTPGELGKLTAVGVGGKLVTLGTVTTTRMEMARVAVRHKGLKPCAAISFLVRPGAQWTEVEKAIRASVAELKLPAAIQGAIEPR